MTRPLAHVTPALAIVLLLAAAEPAHADLTAFVGVNTTPANRPVRGLAAGVSLLMIGFEVEWATSSEDALEAAPGLTTGMGNIFVQTPRGFSGVQLYATAGAGIYRETLETDRTTHVGVNTGGGLKMTLAGPLRLRIDYRVFSLAGDPRHARPQRLYAGLNLAF